MNTTPDPQALPVYDQALARVLEQVTPLEAEPLPMTAALGRVLRQDITADRDQPPFNRSAMDGFAVRSDQIKPAATFPITGAIAAGQPPPPEAPPEAPPEVPPEVFPRATEEFSGRSVAEGKAFPGTSGCAGETSGGGMAHTADRAGVIPGGGG